MRNVLSMMVCVCAVWSFGVVEAQSRKPQSEIFLEDEELDVQADLPSVDFVLNFKELRYESLTSRDSFLEEIFKSVEKDPF